MIDLRQLLALNAVADEGSVARAAVRLSWSQPTVDYHLKNLDRLVGTPLTSRGPRGSSLTPAGTVMLERAREVLALSERALTEVREFAELGHVRLRFGAFPTAAARLLPGITSRLSEIGIDIDATLAEVAPLVNRVNLHTLDAALVYTASGYELPFRAGVHLTPIYTDPLLLAVPAQHRFAHRAVIDPGELRELHDEHWVLGATPGDTLDDVVREQFSAAGHEPRVTIRTDDYSVVLGLVAAGLSVALVPGLAVAQPHEGVALLRIRDEHFARELLLAAPLDQRPHPGNNSARANSSLPARPAHTARPSAAVRQLTEAVRRAVAALEPPPGSAPR